MTEPLRDLRHLLTGRHRTLVEAGQPFQSVGVGAGEGITCHRCLVGHQHILVPSGSARRDLDPAGLAHPSQAHAARLAPYVDPHLARRQAGEKHPVHDFLFGYYSQRPAQLLRWHPGYGVRLADATEFDGLKGYRDGAVTDDTSPRSDRSWRRPAGC